MNRRGMVIVRLALNGLTKQNNSAITYDIPLFEKYIFYVLCPLVKMLKMCLNPVTITYATTEHVIEN